MLDSLLVLHTVIIHLCYHLGLKDAVGWVEFEVLRPRHQGAAFIRRICPGEMHVTERVQRSFTLRDRDQFFMVENAPGLLLGTFVIAQAEHQVCESATVILS